MLLRCQTSDLHFTLYHTLPLILEWKAGLPWWVWRSPAVAGLPKWRWLPDWVTQAVRPVLELAERSLSFVNSSFRPGAWTTCVCRGRYHQENLKDLLGRKHSGFLDVPGLILGVTRKRLIRCNFFYGVMLGVPSFDNIIKQPLF